METYLPFIHHLKEIACHYKATGTVSARALAASELCNRQNALAENSVNNVKRDRSSRGNNGRPEPFKPVVCCGILFKYPSHLKVHQKSFNHLSTTDPINYKVQKRGFQPVKCCGVVFKHPAHWKEHIRSKRHLQRQESGTLCIEGDANQQIDQQVDKSPTKRKVYTCEVCNLTYKYWHPFLLHKRREHENFAGHQCSVCPYTCASAGTLRKHFRFRHLDGGVKPFDKIDSIEPVTCCGVTFYYQSHVDRHKETLKHRNKLVCRMGKCFEEFNTVEEWTNHRATVHYSVGDKFQCPICNSLYASYPLLQRHINAVHAKSITFECSQCAKTFSTKCGLQRHFKERHQESNEKFTCDVCGRKIKSKRNLVAHKKLHEKGKWACATCHMVFQDSEGLEEHHRAHRPCQICGMTFRTLRLRESHINSHLRAIVNEKKKGCPKKKKKCVKKIKASSSCTKESYKTIKSVDKLGGKNKCSGADSEGYARKENENSPCSGRSGESCGILRKGNICSDTNFTMCEMEENESCSVSIENDENYEPLHKEQNEDNTSDVHEFKNYEGRELLKEMPVYFNL